jgi:hypothetical protein
LVTTTIAGFAPYIAGNVHVRAALVQRIINQVARTGDTW